MNPGMRQHLIRSSGCIAGSAILALLGCLPIGGVSAQTAPQKPGEVPYLNYPPANIPGNAPRQPSVVAPATQPNTQPKAPAAAKAASAPQPQVRAASSAPAAAAKKPSGIDTL